MKKGDLLSELSAIDQLDYILSVFAHPNAQPEATIQEICNSVNELSNDWYQKNNSQGNLVAELREIIAQLIDDKNVKSETKKIFQSVETAMFSDDGYVETFYSITFKGRVLLSQGGYVSKIKMDEHLIEIQNRNTLFLTIGTCLAAFGTIGILIFECLKYFRWISSIELWTAFYVLLSCTIAVLMIWLIILEVIAGRKEA